MGDRVVIVVKSGSEIAPAIYGHWIGHEAPQLIKAAGEAGIVRRGDASYSAARICGFIHEQGPRETTGLGLLDAPADLLPETLHDFSHGDAGVIIVDVGDGGDRNQTEGAVSYHAGYHARAEGDALASLPVAVRLVA